MDPNNTPHSEYFRISYHGPPPQPLTNAHPSGAFRLPTYDEAMMIAEFRDSRRLPTYQSRQLGRYHPYWQYMPSYRPKGDRLFENTLFDDQYVPLEVPARVEPSLPTPPLLPHGMEGREGAYSERNTDQLNESEEERWARVSLLRARLADFMYCFHKANSQKMTIENAGFAQSRDLHPQNTTTTLPALADTLETAL